MSKTDEILDKIGRVGYDGLSENEKEYLTKTGGGVKKRIKYKHSDRGFWGWFFSISYTIFLISFTDYMSELSGLYIFLQGLVISVIFIFSFKKIFRKSWLEWDGSSYSLLFFQLFLLVLVYFLNHYFNLGLSIYLLLFFWNLTFSLEILVNNISNKKTDKLDKIDESKEKIRENVRKTNLSDRL